MDQETFICLMRQSQNTYYRVARSILSKEEDAEDAVQEGILKAWQKRNKLKDESLFGHGLPVSLLTHAMT